MSLGCLRLALNHATRATRHPLRSTSPAALLLFRKPESHRPAWCYMAVTLQKWSPFSTEVEDGAEIAENEPQKKKKKKADPKARATISSVGRKIHQRHLQLLGEDGQNLGTMHRVDALRLMDEKGLKLVPVNENSDPPVYRLMSGKQIHEEQMKLREKMKAKAAGIVQVKEMTLSSDIAFHDLETKLKQVVNWLEKKHHIRLTLKSAGHGSTNEALDTVLDQMVERISVPVGFVSKTKLIREGRAAMCILRPPSAKELQQRGAQQGAQTPKPPKSDTYQQKTPSTSQPDQSDDLASLK